jgi:nucleoside-diphosphate-sugar epimerase
MEESSDDSLTEFRSVNVAGTERLAWAAAAVGVRRIIYVSSVKVNGESTKGKPFDEEDPPDPGDPYAVSKWEAEQKLRQISKETGLEVVVLRPPLVYGPGVKANFLSLMKLVDRGLPLPLGSVVNRRSLLYVGNLADAITACVVHPEAPGDIFLLSDGEDISTPDLAHRLAGLLERPARLLPVSPVLLRAGGRLSGRSELVERLLGSLEVDGGKFRRALGWRPPYTLEEGLKETARWFRSEARR